MKRGFSLVELSIVLVILGLLVGGVLSGQSLIRAAELRAVSTEYTRWVTASQTFRDKYFALPGDITNATAFWGATAACPGTAGSGTQTCNGNGDGIINFAPAASQYGELFTFWQHLANAGLIEGNYTGIAGAGGDANGTAVNMPKSKLGNAYWFMHNYNGVFSGNTTIFDGTYRNNMLQLGGLSPIFGPDVGQLKPEEVWNIDTKLDDGRPAYGNVQVRNPTICTTAANSAQLNSEYLLTSSATCTALMFVR